MLPKTVEETRHRTQVRYDNSQQALYNQTKINK